MAATYTAAKFSGVGQMNVDDTWGKFKVRGRTVTLAGTYTTGGDAMTAQLFGLRVLLYLIPLAPATDGTLAYDSTFVRSSAKLKLWETGTAAAGSAEKGSGESLTGITLDCLAVGY
jgi:hypothetical protein